MPLESKPRTVYWLDNKLYLNITNKCSNNCVFCFRSYRSGVGGFNLKLTEEPSADKVTGELISVLNTRNWSEIVFCGFGEPTERLDCLLEITRWIGQRYGKSIPIRVNTNGHGYALNYGRDLAIELKEAGVNKISVSLNGHDETTYNDNCRPKLDHAFSTVIEFVDKAKKELEIEITAVTAPEVQTQKIMQIAKTMNLKFRLRPYIQGFW